jgi:ribosomal protein L19
MLLNKKLLSTSSCFNFKIQKILNLYIGDYITIGLKIYENNKIRLQEYSGLIISQKHSQFNSTVKIRSTFNNIFMECTFFLNLLEILFIKLRYSVKLRRSKLYYLA